MVKEVGDKLQKFSSGCYHWQVAWRRFPLFQTFLHPTSQKNVENTAKECAYQQTANDMPTIILAARNRSKGLFKAVIRAKQMVVSQT